MLKLKLSERRIEGIRWLLKLVELTDGQQLDLLLDVHRGLWVE